jgi:hypothetical protein
VPRRHQPHFAIWSSAGALAGALFLAGPAAHAQGVSQRGNQAASSSTTALTTGATNDPDSFLMSPALDGNPQSLPRFRPTRRGQDSDRSRFGQLPDYGYKPALGAGTTGFDSTNARKRKPGQSPTPGQPSKPGSTPPAGAQPGANISKPETTTSKPESTPRDANTAQPDAAAVPIPKQLQAAGVPLPPKFLLQNRPGAPPLTPDGVIATVAATPPYRRQPIEERPFDPLGIQIGAFNIKPALDYTRGYDNNAPRNSAPPAASSWFNIYAPELLVNSNWERHELTASLRGSYTTYDTIHSLDRPNLDSRVNARIDVSRLTRIDLEGRYLLFTDSPGSPNIQVGVAHLPIAMTYGTTAGFTQAFNRLDVTLKGTFDRTVYNDSSLIDGTTSSNAGRNFNKYGTQLRTAYDVMPGAKPFVEIGLENRDYDLPVDAGGNDRTSRGYYGKVGTTLEFARKLVGEVSFGYLARSYEDPTLEDIRGWTVDSSLTWLATALTTVKLINTTTVTESVLTGVSGAFTRETTLQIEHAFRRWLVATARVTRGFDDYVGLAREDIRYVAATSLAYTLTRELWLRGEYRNEWRRSNQPGNDYFAHVWLVGLRLQR